MLVYQRVVLAHYIQKARTAKLVGSILYWTSACMVSTVNVPSTNPLNVSLHSIMSPWNSINLEWWLHIIINLNNLPVRYRSHLPKNKKYYILPGVGLLLVMYQLVSSHITNFLFFRLCLKQRIPAVMRMRNPHPTGTAMVRMRPIKLVICTVFSNLSAASLSPKSFQADKN